jgi:hypothetical protein
MVEKNQMKIIHNMIMMSSLISTKLDMNGKEGAGCYIQVDSKRIEQMAEKLQISIEEVLVILQDNFGYKK